MSKRKQRKESGASWMQDSGSSGLSLEQAAAVGYGFEIDDMRHVTVTNLDITQIFPDRLQPRRAIPSFVRADWDGSPTAVREVFIRWIISVAEERASVETPDDLWAWLRGILLQDEDTVRPLRVDDPGPVEAALIELAELASSIYAEGLTNPITVVRGNDIYLLETGERRWLAYHLLNTFFGTDKGSDGSSGGEYTRIPTRVMDDFNVWRQAGENNARRNLNAVGRARQYALLLMDLLAQQGHEFQPYEALVQAGGIDRPYYAQVADMRAPSGKNEQLMAAMGLSNRASISRLKSILTLPDDVWQLGDDYNMAEKALATLSQLPPGAASTEARKIVTPGNNSAAKKPVTSRSRSTQEAGSKPHFSDLSRALRRIGAGREKYNKHALQRIRELREWLDEKERLIENLLEE